MADSPELRPEGGVSAQDRQSLSVRYAALKRQNSGGGPEIGGEASSAGSGFDFSTTYPVRFVKNIAARAQARVDDRRRYVPFNVYDAYRVHNAYLRVVCLNHSRGAIGTLEGFGRMADTPVCRGWAIGRAQPRFGRPGGWRDLHSVAVATAASRRKRADSSGGVGLM